MAVSRLISSLGLGAAGNITKTTLFMLLALPAVSGASVGYAYKRLKSPSNEDFSNIGREMVLTDLERQRIQTRRLDRLRKLRGGLAERGGTVATSAADREIRL